MKAENLKFEIRKILGDNISFNKGFYKYAKTIKNIDSALLDWCNKIKENKIRAIIPSIKKDYIIYSQKS